jgi:hypothetical protein
LKRRFKDIKNYSFENTTKIGFYFDEIDELMKLEE